MAYKIIIHDLKLLKYIFLNNHLKIVREKNKRHQMSLQLPTPLMSLFTPHTNFLSIIV